MNINRLTIKKQQELYLNKTTTVSEKLESCISKIEENKEINSFITLNIDKAREIAKRQDEKIKNGEKLGKLFGVIIGMKDNVLTKGLKTTCASKMLENYIPLYDASLVKKIYEEDGIIIGKTNMDEFAMGSTSETSYFGLTKNPNDLTRVAGGSSSGSASSVKTGEVMIAVGSDTGGSIREPASFCGVVGVKPSYGLVSRYGVISMANTLDTVGVLSNNVEDAELFLEVIGGNDVKDYTSIKEEMFNSYNEKMEFKDLTFVKPKNIEKYISDEDIKKDFDNAIEKIISQGAKIVEFDFKYLEYSLEVYQILVSCEVNGNTARFDGIRYGFKAGEYKSLEDLYIKTRSEGFGDEVKRRIALGALYLSSKDNQVIYNKAMEVRQLIIEELDKAIGKYAAILTPTTVTKPGVIGEVDEQPLKMYLADIFTIPVNISGYCGISLPINNDGSSIQVIGKRDDDSKALHISKMIEEVI